MLCIYIITLLIIGHFFTSFASRTRNYYQHDNVASKFTTQSSERKRNDLFRRGGAIAWRTIFNNTKEVHDDFPEPVPDPLLLWNNFESESERIKEAFKQKSDDLLALVRSYRCLISKPVAFVCADCALVPKSRLSLLVNETPLDRLGRRFAMTVVWFASIQTAGNFFDLENMEEVCFWFLVNF